MSEGELRFGELEQRSGGLGAKTLSARLKELERRSLVVRTVDPGPPVRVSYALTAKGRAFGQVAAAIQRWGRDLVEEPNADRSPSPAAAAPRRSRAKQG